MKNQLAITRRKIFRGAAASAISLGFPTIIPSSALGKDGKTAPSNRVTLACIGVGGRGTDDLKNFLNDERVQIIAVCDVDRGSDRYNRALCKKFGNLGREPARDLINKHYGTTGCATHGDFREVLARKDVDAVLIATPDHWHALQAIAAARAKKHIYCEKPISLTVEQGQVMSRIVKESGVVWQTGSQQRSDIHFRMACEFVRNGRIGKLKTVRVGLASQNRDNNGNAARTAPEPVPEGLDYALWLGPAPDAPYCPARLHSNWRWIYDYSGGNVTDFGAHHLDIVQWALDTEHSGPVLFDNFKATWPPKGELYNTPPTFSFECEYASGVSVKVADQMDFGSGIQFEGEGGTITCQRGGLVVKPDSARVPLTGKETHLYESKDHYLNFIDGVLTGKPTATAVDVSHRSITIAHLANIGLRLGREKLRWNPEAEQIIGDDEAQQMLSRPMRGDWHLG